MGRGSFLQRLIERRVFHWTLAYLAAALVVYQGAHLLAGNLRELPIILAAVQTLLLLGFLLTLVVAWHHGEPGRQQITGREVLILAAVLLAGGTALTLLRGVGQEVRLPPGFTITSGSDTEKAMAREGRGGRAAEEPLGDLIASTVTGSGEQFQASIAVLPLENRTEEPVFDTLGTPMTEDLIGRLSRIRGLKVISRQSVQELAGLELSPPEIADTLDVDHLLRGIVSVDDGAARIQVELLEVGPDSGDVLWQNDYSLDRVNQMRAVEEISDEVSAALLVEVPTLSLRRSSRTTESPGYVHYLAGNRLLNTRTRDGVQRAVQAFQTALEQDSAFALAYAGLSSAYALSITYRYRIDVDAYAAAGLALEAADAGVALDPELAEAYAARGYVSSLSLAPAQEVAADFARAMELQPNAPNVAAWYANLLIREGYYNQALAEAQRAVQLDPLSPARRTGLAYEALRARDYDLAVEQARAAEALEADVMLPRSIHAQALLLSGRAEECLEMDLGPHAGIRALCLHALGRVEDAERIADSLRNEVRGGDYLNEDYTAVIPSGDLAGYYAWTGDTERALPWIYRAFSLSPSGIDPRVLESGLFDELFRDPSCRREVETIRSQVWPRVLREKEEAFLAVGSGDG
jgi:TolB-like protein